MAPGEWSYELIEAWYPNTTWNMNRNDIAIYSSHEFFEGRKTYAEIGGCYYAARLAVSELFERIQKQAKVVIMRKSTLAIHCRRRVEYKGACKAGPKAGA